MKNNKTLNKSQTVIIKTNPLNQSSPTMKFSSNNHQDFPSFKSGDFAKFDESVQEEMYSDSSNDSKLESNSNFRSTFSPNSNFSLVQDRGYKGSYDQTQFEYEFKKRIKGKKRVCIIVNNLDVLPPEKWTLSDNCFSCKKELGKSKLARRHHCRLCGKSVCSMCSEKTVNKLRACDFCFVKQKYNGTSETWQNKLITMQNMLNDYNKLCVKLSKIESSLDQQSQSQANYQINQKKTNEKNCKKFQQEIDYLRANLTRKEEDKTRKLRNYDQSGQLVSNKKESLNIQKKDVDNITEEVDKKKQILESKKKEFNDLLDTIKELYGEEGVDIVLNPDKRNQYMNSEKSYNRSAYFEDSIRYNETILKTNFTDSYRQRTISTTLPEDNYLKFKPNLKEIEQKNTFLCNIYGAAQKK